MSEDRYAWLDDIIRKISFVYQDDFQLLPAGREESYEEKHGSCQKCTYRFVFRDGVEPKLPPDKEGARLMRLIKQAAKIAKADPPLVQTRIRGHHDFADWGWTPTGAEMWIFLEIPNEE